MPWWLSLALNAICGLWFAMLVLGFVALRREVEQLRRDFVAAGLHRQGDRR